MGKGVWLRLVKGTVLDISRLRDVNQQPLFFRTPTLIRRGVSEETFNHELVQRYVANRMLIVEAAASPVTRHAAAPAAPPVVVPAPAVEPAPVSAPVTAASVEEPLAPSPVLPETVVEETIETVSAPSDVVDAAPVLEEVLSEVSDGPTPSPETADPSPEPLPSMDEEMRKPSTDTPRRRRRG